MKILIIGDIHLGESQGFASHTGVIRQANSQAEAALSSLIPYFNSLKCDLVVHTGDALRDTYQKEIDKQNTVTVMNLLAQIQAPKIHLLGNHELRAFSLAEMHELYKKAGVEQEFFGVQEFTDVMIVWLDMKLDEKNRAFLSQDRIAWLKALPSSTKKTLVFTHYSLIPINADGTFYFENQPQGMHFLKSDTVVTALESLHPQLCINGHVHLLTHQEKNRVHYLSVPSFSENIAAEQYPDNHPGIFSLLDIHANEFVFSTYSRMFCFSKIQGQLF